jgi:tRNA G18 (ribose-2'-O)-methylase SpoU
MWENTVAIQSILKKKKLQSRIFNQLNILKVKSIKIIFLKKNKWKKKSKVRKKRKIILKKKRRESWKKNEKMQKKKRKKHCGLLL